MATDYISREAAIDAICGFDLKSPEFLDGWSRRLIEAVKKDLTDDLNAIPAADVRPVVRGEWVEDDYGFIHCSICGTEWDEPEHPKTNFCPNCGADMREVEP